jgi:hypothetical protein
MTGLTAFLDARSNTCYKENNVGRDHNLDGDDRGALHGSDGQYRAIVHSFQRAGTTSVQAGLLRQQNVLRDFKPA